MRDYLRETLGEPRWRVLGSEVAPKISMLAPAFNEEANISMSVRAFLGHYYPNLEVVVVNDGSKDNTMGVMIEEFELVAVAPIYKRTIETKAIKALYRSKVFPNLIVIDKQNGGKADAPQSGHPAGHRRAGLRDGRRHAGGGRRSAEDRATPS